MNGGSNMKVIIMLCLSFLLMTNLCFAAVPDDLGNLLQQYKELSMLFEVGISHQDFSPKYQQLYINTRNLEDKKPEYKEDLDTLFDVYKDVEDLWELYIQYDYFEMHGKDDKYFLKYPSMYPNLKKYHDNKYEYVGTTDVILYLGNTEVKQQIKTIEAKYN